MSAKTEHTINNNKNNNKLYFTWHGHLNIRFPLLKKHHVSITGKILRAFYQ